MFLKEHLKAGPIKGQRCQLCFHPLLQAPTYDLPLLRQGRCRSQGLLLELVCPLSQNLELPVHGLDLLEFLLSCMGIFKNRSQRIAVFTFELLQILQPFTHLFQAIWIGLQRIPILAQPITQILSQIAILNKLTNQNLRIRIKLGHLSHGAT